MKISVVFLIAASLFGGLSLRAQTCGTCVGNPTTSLQFPANTGPSKNPGTTLTIPYDAGNISKTFRIEMAPHPFNSGFQNSTLWDTYLEVLINGAVAISSFHHIMGSNSSSKSIPFSAFSSGTNVVVVNATCSNSNKKCNIGTFTVIVSPQIIPAANITLTPACCTRTVVMPGNPHTVQNTGKVNFKMAGTGMNFGGLIQFRNADGVFNESFAAGRYTACYSCPVAISLVTPQGRPVSANGWTNFTYYKRRGDCLDAKAPDPKIITLQDGK